MIYVSICDDDRKMAQKIEGLVSKELSFRNLEFQCSIFYDGQSFLEKYSEKENELIILDIEMPDISGIHIAEFLKKKDRNNNIVFITGYDNFVFRSLEFFPFSFIRKRKLEQEFKEMMEQFLKRIQEQQAVFLINTQKKTIMIFINDIMYLTYLNHKIILCTKRKEKYEFRGSMKECEQKLKFNHFYRINSGCIVNLKYAIKFEDSCIIMDDCSSFLVSREKKKECKLKFMEYWRENV